MIGHQIDLAAQKLFERFAEGDKALGHRGGRVRNARSHPGVALGVALGPALWPALGPALVPVLGPVLARR